MTKMNIHLYKYIHDNLQKINYCVGFFQFEVFNSKTRKEIISALNNIIDPKYKSDVKFIRQTHKLVLTFSDDKHNYVKIRRGCN